MVSTSVKWPSVFVWLRRITAALFALSFVLLMMSLIHFNTIPGKYLWMTMPVYGVIAGVLAWLLLDQKRLQKRKIIVIIFMVVALLFSAANV